MSESDTDHWEFDIYTVGLDELKDGSKKRIRSRVLVSRREYPTYGIAAETAACLAMAAHKGTATDVLVRI